MEESIHIGRKIEELLKEARMSKRELGEKIGMSTSNTTYLATRESIDVRTLQKIGIALHYDFFKHFPISEINRPITEAPKSSTEQIIEDLQKQIEERDKMIEDVKRENGYLKEINTLLKRK